jgi:hypothetical protein
MEDGEDEDEEMSLGQQHSTAVIQVAWPVHNLIPLVTPHTSRLTLRHTNTSCFSSHLIHTSTMHRCSKKALYTFAPRTLVYTRKLDRQHS